MAERITTTSRLRDAINSGRTGDKVAFEDPAASPLGTDDEAAGTPPSAEAVAHAARHEVRKDGIAAPAVSDERGRSISGDRRGGWLTASDSRPWLIGAGSLLLLGAVFVVAAAL